MRTRARRDGSDWFLERDEDVDHERLDRRRRGGLGANGRGEINGFLVERGIDGFTARR